MKRFYILPIGLFACLLVQAEEILPLYQVGETWIFDVKGAEFGIFGKEDLDEMEVKKIAGVREIDGIKYWAINKKNGSSLQKEYIDAEGSTHCVDFEGRSRALSVNIVPPMPDYLRLGFNVGETKQQRFEMIPRKSSLLKLNMTAEFAQERLEDATVTVPAGTFTNCFRYRETGHMLIGDSPNALKINFRCDIWAHPSVKAVVKDITVFEPADSRNAKGSQKEERITLLRRYSPGRNR